MNNNYLLTTIANSLGVFEPKNYIKYKFDYTEHVFENNKLYFNSDNLKDNKQYLFNFYIPNIEIDYIKEINGGYIIKLLDNEITKEFSDVGKIKINYLREVIDESLYYEFISEFEIKVKTEKKLFNPYSKKGSVTITYLDTCNHSGIYLVQNIINNKYKIESINMFNPIYNFDIFNSPFIYYKTNEEDVIEEDKRDDNDPNIIYIYPTTTIVNSNNYDNNYTFSQTTKTTIFKIITSIKINDNSLEGAEDLQYFINNELPIIIDSIQQIDTDFLDVVGIKIIKGEPIFNNGISIFYELTIEIQEVFKKLTSPKLNDCISFNIF